MTPAITTATATRAAAAPRLTSPSALELLTGLMEQLSQLQTLLVGEPCGSKPRPLARPQPAISPRPYPNGRCPQRQAASRERVEQEEERSWDWPWDEMSVVELRALLRCYPIDRSALPAPIELLRRDELLEALHQLQPCLE